MCNITITNFTVEIPPEMCYSYMYTQRKKAVKI